MPESSTSNSDETTRALTDHYWHDGLERALSDLDRSLPLDDLRLHVATVEYNYLEAMDALSVATQVERLSCLLWLLTSAPIEHPHATLSKALISARGMAKFQDAAFAEVQPGPCTYGLPPDELRTLIERREYDYLLVMQGLSLLEQTERVIGLLRLVALQRLDERSSSLQRLW